MIEHDGIDGTFADVLASLRERGSGVLVCGTPPEETTARMCRRLLGQHSGRPHDRVLVATEPGAAERLDPDAPGRAALVESAALARSTAAVADTGGSRSPAGESGPSAGAVPSPGNEAISFEHDVVESGSLAALGGAVSDRLTALGAAATSAGGLRVGIESLDPLFAEYPSSAVFQFAHLLAGQVRADGGMLHAHVGVGRDHEHVRLLTPIFDVVVELRRTAAGDQHRWHLPDQDRSTAWLALDERPREE